MSSGQLTRHRSKSSRSQNSKASERSLPQPSAPFRDQPVRSFEPCAATGSYFLYAQRNTILSLHHDTLAIDRKFEKHREDVLLISADNISERGFGRLIVSYDAGQTAIVWDLHNGDEVARFASYEQIRVATWMRDGSIAFGKLCMACTSSTQTLMLFKVIPKAISSSSNLPPPSISQRERYLIQ